MTSRKEQTVIRAIQSGYYAEEIRQEFGVSVETVHFVARRHGLRSYCAPTRPDFMRLKKIAGLVESLGLEHAAIFCKLAPTTVRDHVRRFRRMDSERPCSTRQCQKNT